MKRIFVISSLLLISIFACVKEEEFEDLTPANYTGEWGAPLINSSITFDELLKQYEKNSEIPVKVITDKDNVYHLIYTDSIESPEMETYYKIQDVLYNGSLGVPTDQKSVLPFNIPFPISTTVQYDTILKEKMSIPLDFENKPIPNAQIKYIELNDGQLLLDVNSDFQHDVQLTLTMNALTKNGIPLKVPIDLNNTTNGQISIPQKEISLAGYRLDLTNGGSTIDSVYFHVDVVFKTATGKSIQVNDNIDVKMEIKRMKYYAIVGKLGEFKIPLEKGNMEFNIFNDDEKNTQAKVTIQDPKIDLRFVNELGVPFGIEFQELLLQNTAGEKRTIELADGQEVKIDHVKGIENLGDSVITLFGLTDETTNNFTTAFAIAPNQFSYDFLAIIGDNVNSDFFLHEQAKVKVAFTADIPVAGAIESYTFEEELNDFAIGDLDTSSVDYAEIRLTTNNGWPFTIDVQGYFVNDKDQVIDSLFTGGRQVIIQSGTLDANGIVTAPVEQKTIISLDRARYAKVSEATKMRYKLSFKTGTDGKEITKILSTYRLGLMMSAKVKLNASFE